MNIAQLLLRSATVYPERPAILHGAQVLHDYRAFAGRAAAIAGGLRARGYGAGERVALFMTNCPEYLEVLYGIWWAGLVAVPVNAKLHPRELAYVLDDAGACCLFLGADLAGETAPLLGGLPCVTPGTVA